MKTLVTGGAGFIGSAVVRRLIGVGDTVVNLDKLTYAANLDSLSGVSDNPRYHFEHADICDGNHTREIFKLHQPNAVMHLAAESHVDRSIDGPSAFIQTNIVGTYRLLEVALEYYQSLNEGQRQAFRFHHVSTDEVYGALSNDDAPFTLETAYAPRSPYSASKAASDHLALAWRHTYGLPVVLSNSSNNYGPFQFPEKLIPLMIIRALKGNSLPVYGTGKNVRDWLFVEDHAAALEAVLKRGEVGEDYLVGGDAEHRNIDVVDEICRLLDELIPDSPYRPHGDLITFVEDRPGHDLRYAVDSTKIRDQLGWAPTEPFEDGLRKTVMWYLDNWAWWEKLIDERYDGGRLGLLRREGG